MYYMSQFGDLIMRTKYQESIEYKALILLKATRGSVVLRKDFKGIGSYRQISRALNKLISEKKLVKIGTGIYAKSYLSKYSEIPLVKNGTDITLRAALKRLGVAYEPGSAEKDYNEGKSTQVPVRNIVKLKSRCRRRIGYRNSELIFEKKINAK
jgi:Family of unknown function (DUF6088)